MSLHWLVLGFLYAFSVQWRILQGFYPIPPPTCQRHTSPPTHISSALAGKSLYRGKKALPLVQLSISFLIYKMTDCAEGSTQNDFFLPTKMGSARRLCKFIAPPKGKLLSFSIGAFLNNYDITNKKQYKALIYSIGAKTTF